ncbi:uncharacterized protein BJX67DRAFT_354280 [Aspergillus lucknowensis]|uniref:NAD(P)-binding domain-containing protein n=1 Tax=Aspergillus lucknowensis TaxID=176173 RepID=A0ABR4LQS4_9EURO
MNKPTLAFFGATGGCTVACLGPALQDGYNCVALARTPKKLTDLLISRGIPQSTISTHLTIIEGSTTDVNAVTRTLFPENLPQPDMIISGVGGAPDFSNPISPKFIGKTVCQDTVRNILSALREATRTAEKAGEGKKKPVLVCISSTGLTKERDIPLAMVPLYNWGLKVPHADKRVMEGIVFEEIARPEGERVIRDYVLVRPSFLTNGASQPGKVRILKGKGEGQNTAVGIACPFVGYTICRDDVGGFMYGLVKELDGEIDGKEGYFGSVVSISH